MSRRARRASGKTLSRLFIVRQQVKMKPTSFQSAVFTVLGLVATYSLSTSGASFRSSSTIYGEEKVIVSENIDRADGKFVFANCDEKQFPSKIVCTLSVKKLPTEKQTFGKTCEFYPTVKGKVMMKPFPLDIDLLGQGKKALISWKELSSNSQSLKKYLVIKDMESCEETYLGFTYFDSHPNEHVLFSNVVVYEHQFDVIISDPNKCGEFPRCRMSFNDEGQQLGSTLPFPTDHFAVRTVSALAESTEKGFFVFVGSITVSPSVYPLKLGYVLASGSDQLNLSSNITYDSSLSSPIFSNAHKLFTICGLTDRQIHCSQYKIGSVDPFFDRSVSNVENVAAVHNLAGGGFLLLSMHCDPDSRLSCTSFKVMKVDADDKSVKDVANRDFDLMCTGDLDQIVVISKDEDTGVCFYFACVHETIVDSKKIHSKFTVHKDCLQIDLRTNKN